MTRGATDAKRLGFFKVKVTARAEILKKHFLPYLLNVCTSGTRFGLVVHHLEPGRFVTIWFSGASSRAGTFCANLGLLSRKVKVLVRVHHQGIFVLTMFLNHQTFCNETCCVGVSP